MDGTIQTGPTRKRESRTSTTQCVTYNEYDHLPERLP